MPSVMPIILRSGFLAAGLGLAALTPLAPAFADQAAGAACASKLSPESQMIYAAAAPKVTPTTDLRSVLKATARGLVMSGKIPRSTARPSAVAAYPCLQALQ